MTWPSSLSVDEDVYELANGLHLFLPPLEDADLVRDGILT
jgi:hypothetical protein